ncbi:hypothetical protein DNI29_14155 [Hymenobacter sediminis]|uniref:hypothetical protein n=1 Tax=Hymenobacter sediminis TaxID=2218621 RepID=UPI000DA64B6A|nr:hypothetical protein [Hymenobacter sediminis]RPD46146.1 hypothetical protein DNI29_14155 [Hymenobacter sediminis]
MRFRSIALLLPLLSALTACETSLSPGPRVDLISSTRFNTADRRLTRPADTVAAKMFAEAKGSPLRRLVISAEYFPVPEPIIYPSNATAPPDTSRRLVYLDSTLASNTEINQAALTHVLSSRTTSGLEVWRFEATDAEGRTGVRSFNLRFSRTDSAQQVHSYSIPVQAPGTSGRRSFLALREGLAFPKFSVRTLAENQALVDLVYVTDSTTGAPTLATVRDAKLKLPWSTRRGTVIRKTTFNASTYANVTNYLTSFNQGTPFDTPTRTGPLAKGQVIAFEIPLNATESVYGLILVEEVVITGIRTLVLQVRYQK